MEMKTGLYVEGWNNEVWLLFDINATIKSKHPQSVQV